LSHTLLELADRFDLPDLEKDYLALAKEKVPLSPETAAFHLNVSEVVGDAESKETCIHLLASNMQSTKWMVAVSMQFRELDVEHAQAVLAHDDLDAQNEKNVLCWFLKSKGSQGLCFAP
jgi:hypothetical protein